MKNDKILVIFLKNIFLLKGIAVQPEIGMSS
jgi:hypothetical protein